MISKLRIAVADDDTEMLEFFAEGLVRLGHDVVAMAENGRDLVTRCRQSKPDLVITDIKMPELDGLEAARQIYRDAPLPIVVISAYHDDEFVQRAVENHIMAFLVKPIRESHLAPAIAVAMRRFEEFAAARKEANDFRQALQDRKAIEIAKGIMMRQAQLDEAAAFRRLQKLASSLNKRLVDVAQMIITTANALKPNGDDSS